jgi:hypothetical protein
MRFLTAFHLRLKVRLVKPLVYQQNVLVFKFETKKVNHFNSIKATGTIQSGWMNQIDAKALQILNKQYSTASTQTYGLYYTSSKAIENSAEKVMKNESTDAKRPPMTAVSAGRGYWRQQMDHICAHLKAFAQNTPEFRAVVGEPKLGKVNKRKKRI